MKTVVTVFLSIFLLTACSDGAPDESTSQVSDFTPPPLAENPPMSGADIDAIDREVKERAGHGS